MAPRNGSRGLFDNELDQLCQDEKYLMQYYTSEHTDHQPGLEIPFDLQIDVQPDDMTTVHTPLRAPESLSPSSSSSNMTTPDTPSAPTASWPQPTTFTIPFRTVPVMDLNWYQQTPCEPHQQATGLGIQDYHTQLQAPMQATTSTYDLDQYQMYPGVLLQNAPTERVQDSPEQQIIMYNRAPPVDTPMDEQQGSDGDNESSGEQPDMSYAKLLEQCLLCAPNNHTRALREIYGWVATNSRKASKEPGSNGWQNSVRHNLSMNGGFVRAGGPPQKKGERMKDNSLWRLSDDALQQGIISTTRYRQDAKKRKAPRPAGEPPAIKRQQSGAKGGQATRDASRRQQKQKLRKAVPDRPAPPTSVPCPPQLYHYDQHVQFSSPSMNSSASSPAMSMIQSPQIPPPYGFLHDQGCPSPVTPHCGMFSQGGVDAPLYGPHMPSNLIPVHVMEHYSQYELPKFEPHHMFNGRNSTDGNEMVVTTPEMTDSSYYSDAYTDVLSPMLASSPAADAIMQAL